MTRNGIFYDLTLSPFTVQIDNLVFYFSSKLHKKKFKEKVENEIKRINLSISRRFGVEVNMKYLACVTTYIKIEGRGFLIFNACEGVFYNCKQNLILNGGILTQKTLQKE